MICQTRTRLIGAIAAVLAIAAVTDAAPPRRVTDAALTQELADRLQVDRVDVQTITVQAVDGRVETEVELDGESMRLSLHPHSLRSDDFTYIVDGPDGLEERIPPPPGTFRGDVTERPGAIVAATVHGGRVRAIVLEPDRVWAVEPADRILPGAPKELHVVYRSEDRLPANVTCGVVDGGIVPEQNEGGVASDFLSDVTVACPPAVRIALDLDNPFVLLHATPEDAVIDAESIINAMEVVYAWQLNIGYEIVGMIVREAGDPYSGTSPIGCGQLLGEFEFVWDTEPIERDVAHLFTGRELEFDTVGCADLAVTCVQADAYGLSESLYNENEGGSTPFISRVELTTHELGHNWSAVHCVDDPGPPQVSCDIMCASISRCGPNDLLFADAAVTAILNYRDIGPCTFAGAAEVMYFPRTEVMPPAEEKMDDDPQTLQFFGLTVDIADDPIEPRMVVGAPFYDTEIVPPVFVIPDTGRALVYRFEGLTRQWELEQILEPDPELRLLTQGDVFGQAVKIDQDLIAVGAPLDDDEKLSSGAVYMFERSGTRWTNTQRLLADDADNGDAFGSIVDIFEDLLLISAPNDDENGTDAGAVYVFERKAGAWVQLNKIIPDDGANGDQFGRSADMSADPDTGQPRLLIGSYRADGDPDDPPRNLICEKIDGRKQPIEQCVVNIGAAYIFERFGDIWVGTRLQAPEPMALEQFGVAVALDGNRAVIGANNADMMPDPETGLIEGGSVYVMDRNTGTGEWDHTATLRPPPEDDPVSAFGAEVEVQGDLILVGAQASHWLGANGGLVYVYALFDEWTYIGRVVPIQGVQGDQFGISLGLDNGLAAVGAWLDSGAGTFVGSASVYEIQILDCNNNGEFDACEGALGITPDCNGNGIPDSCDVSSGEAEDINNDGVPDTCDVDCNGNGMPDLQEVADATSPDCNRNFVPDDCDIDMLDPDNNGQVSGDCNGNLVPDECDIAGGAGDCNANGVPDECDVAAEDCNNNGTPDSCELTGADCNTNGVPDSCDISSGTSMDTNGNLVPDECEMTTCPADIDNSGVVAVDDLVLVILFWGTNAPLADINDDGIVDVDDLLEVILNWGAC